MEFGKYLLCEVEVFCYNCFVLWFGNYMWIFRIGKIRIVDCQIDWKYQLLYDEYDFVREILFAYGKNNYNWFLIEIVKLYL